MGVMPIEKRGITKSRLIYGCMALGGAQIDQSLTQQDIKHAEQAIDAALSIGITMFDHADVYRRGKAEEAFGHILHSRPGLREQITIQSKCGVRLGEGGVAVQYDLSKSWILRAVDETLRRLQTEYLDILLLHRPDPLVQYEEVSEAFTSLTQSGKVRYFGVSNMSATQMLELERHVAEPLVVNQLEMSLGTRDWIEQDVLINEHGLDASFPDGTLQYCQAHDVQLQAWASLARGIYSGAAVDTEDRAQLDTSALVTDMAESKATTREAIVLAWLLRHPANIQPVIGTANPDRIRACEDSVRQAEMMTRSEWYSLFISARGSNPP